MSIYKYDINRIVTLCEIFGQDYSECIITSGMHTYYFKPWLITNNTQISSNNIVKDVHLPILILHNQHIGCLHDFNKNEPYLEFIVGAMV